MARILWKIHLKITRGWGNRNFRFPFNAVRLSGSRLSFPGVYIPHSGDIEVAIWLDIWILLKNSHLLFCCRDAKRIYKTFTYIMETGRLRRALLYLNVFVEASAGTSRQRQRSSTFGFQSNTIARIYV